MDISSLSASEYALINASWLCLTNENFQCKKTEELLNKRKDAKDAIKFTRIKKGCGKLFDSPKIEVDGFGYHSCLCHENFQHPNMGNLLQLHSLYEKGTLPYTGSVVDQPNHIMEIFSLFDKLKSEYELEKQKKMSEDTKGKKK